MTSFVPPELLASQTSSSSSHRSRLGSGSGSKIIGCSSSESSQSSSQFDEMMRIVNNNPSSQSSAINTIHRNVASKPPPSSDGNIAVRKPPSIAALFKPVAAKSATPTIAPTASRVNHTKTLLFPSQRPTSQPLGIGTTFSQSQPTALVDLGGIKTIASASWTSSSPSSFPPSGIVKTEGKKASAIDFLLPSSASQSQRSKGAGVATKPLDAVDAILGKPL